ncbi:MAG: patatin-like phospholipase family protein [Dehalococcoidales bacterium]|nr:patatin-like phospholipase family protein [Dehalococcoidales bacterium]
MARKKVGLALGGGAARGLAHIGVLDVLEREEIPIDMIAGTSMGAIVGSIYSRTRNVKLMRELAIAFGSRKIRYFSDFTVPRTGLIKGHRIENELRTAIGADTRFRDLSIPFSCVAVDIDTGEEIVIKEGKVWEAVRASASVPVVFTVPKLDGRYLVDGGLLNPVPTKTVRDMGADFIISVNVLPYKSVSDNREPNIFSIMMKAFYILDSKFIETSIQGSDVVIQPDVTAIAFTDFQRAEECIEKGELAAWSLLPEIKRKLSIR